jgi:hypothetical protein
MTWSNAFFKNLISSRPLVIPLLLMNLPVVLAQLRLLLLLLHRHTRLLTHLVLPPTPPSNNTLKIIPISALVAGSVSLRLI